MKAKIKTKQSAMSSFKQYQVWQNNMLIKSFYDKNDAINLKNKLNHFYDFT